MQVDVRYRPSFATLFVTLSAGDTIIAESGAMATMTGKTAMKTRFNGGFFAGLMKKFFGGESLFVNEFSCAEGATEAQVVLTQPTPGDIQQIDLNGNSLYLQGGSFIACGPNVTLGLGWAGFASWFGGEGLFRLKVSGQGPVWFGGYGGIFARAINGDYKVDTGHLIAYEPTLSISVALSGGLFSSLFGGEGFVSKLQGQGTIYMQTRSVEGLAAWTNSHW